LVRDFVWACPSNPDLTLTLTLGLAGAGWGWLGLAEAGWGWLALAGAGWGWLGLAGLAGAGWGWLGLAGAGWGWLGLAGSVWGGRSDGRTDGPIDGRNSISPPVYIQSSSSIHHCTRQFMPCLENIHTPNIGGFKEVSAVAQLGSTLVKIAQ